LKEAQTYRMNFLKQGSSGFTYRGMIYGLIAWCLFLGLLLGIQVGRSYMIKRDIELAKQRIVSFDTEKERQIELIKIVSKKRMGVSARQDLASILANRPRWERMLREIKRALPAGVWLDSLNVKQEGNWYKVDMTGNAKSQRMLTSFILQLEESGYFSKTALDNTQLSGNKSAAFEFELGTEPVARRLLRDD